MVSFSLLFQFTRPRGARPLSGIPQCLQFEVSIHAPAWGATGTGGCSQITDWGFNSRARVGRDALGSVLSALGVVSIHAPAWGATAQNHRLTILVCVSIHAPAWGATHLPIRSLHDHQGFNSRARVGRDLICSL